ncbi:hypothetical protein NL676_024006 [Syzygium grande]|nr:hypothetical protein NL676_024006 [Syzygium grande]
MQELYLDISGLTAMVTDRNLLATELHRRLPSLLRPPYPRLSQASSSPAGDPSPRFNCRISLAGAWAELVIADSEEPPPWLRRLRRSGRRRRPSLPGWIAEEIYIYVFECECPLLCLPCCLKLSFFGKNTNSVTSLCSYSGTHCLIYKAKLLEDEKQLANITEKILEGNHLIRVFWNGEKTKSRKL